MGDARAFLRHALVISAGPLIWFAHFTIVYVWTALLCARGVGMDLIPAGILAATVVAAAAVIVFAILSFRAMRRAGRNGGGNGRFLFAVAAALAALSLIGILWNGLPAVLVSACS